MAARQLNVLDGIERQMTRGRPKKGEGKKSRSDNKLSSDANRGDINVETGLANEIAAQALPCQSAASDVTVVPPTEVASVPAMAATQADFQQLQTTVSALAEQMSWFVDRLKEDDDGELIPDADIVETTASTSSAVPAPDESNRNEVNVLTGLQQFYGASENVAAAIDDQLANIVGGLSANKLAEDKLRDKLEAYPRAENCPGLVVAKVNQEVWDKLSPGTRSTDIKLQRVQNSTVQAMVAITQAADNLVTFSRSGEMDVAHTLTALVDGLALLGNATLELNQRRRDGHRSDLNAQYKGLCNSDATGAGLLYGDDLHNRIKAIGETNRLSSKLATSAGGGSSYTQRGRSGYRSQPYSTRGRATWAGKFRSSFLERGARHSYRGKSSTQAQRGQHKSARAGYNKRKDM